MNETQNTLERLYSEAAGRLNLADSPGDVESEMAKFLYAVRAHPEEREFVSDFLKREVVGPATPWEFLQFCFHGLRWPELYEFVKKTRDKNINDLRARPILEHLLDAFRDDWEDAGFYREYSRS